MYPTDVRDFSDELPDPVLASADVTGKAAPERAACVAPSAANKTAHVRSSRSIGKLRWLLVLVVGLILFRYVVPPALEDIQYRLTRGRQRAQYETAGPALQSLNLQQLSAAFQLLSQRVGPSVVDIATRSAVRAADDLNWRSPRDPDDGDLRSQEPADSRGWIREQGSGVIIDPAGYIVTNYHVVVHAESIDVTLSDGRRVEAELVGFDWLTDLAVLKIHADDLLAAQWGDSDQLGEGALVWAVGTPYGLKPSITAGIVSAKSLAGIAGSAYQDYLQTDAAVNPGSSGGPLVDVQGTVVGINTAIVGESYRGISFAVPSSIARTIYERIRAHGYVQRGWLGVELGDLTAQRAHRLGLGGPLGAFVEAVGHSDEDGLSPAAEAGVQAGDVIVKWNDTVIDSKHLLQRQVAQTPTGSRVQVEVLRDGRHITLEVMVGKRPRGTAELPVPNRSSGPSPP